MGGECYEYIESRFPLHCGERPDLSEIGASVGMVFGRRGHENDIVLDAAPDAGPVVVLKGRTFTRAVELTKTGLLLTPLVIHRYILFRHACLDHPDLYCVFHLGGVDRLAPDIRFDTHYVRRLDERLPSVEGLFCVGDKPDRFIEHALKNLSVHLPLRPQHVRRP